MTEKKGRMAVLKFSADWFGRHPHRPGMSSPRAIREARELFLKDPKNPRIAELVLPYVEFTLALRAGFKDEDCAELLDVEPGAILYAAKNYSEIAFDPDDHEDALPHITPACDFIVPLKPGVTLEMLENFEGGGRGYFDSCVEGDWNFEFSDIKFAEGYVDQTDEEAQQELEDDENMEAFMMGERIEFEIIDDDEDEEAA